MFGLTKGQERFLAVTFCAGLVALPLAGMAIATFLARALFAALTCFTR